MKKILSLIKFLNWNKDDLKKFIFCIVIIIIFCIALRITLDKTKVWVVGDIDATVSGSVDTNTEIIGSVLVTQ